ncbi:MAG: hypothetical protein K8R91_01420, partial [Phycisphaerae bacterium]|nr:hypothetical protein [Phycisphaerae bacterium]
CRLKTMFNPVKRPFLQEAPPPRQFRKSFFYQNPSGRMVVHEDIALLYRIGFMSAHAQFTPAGN